MKKITAFFLTVLFASSLITAAFAQSSYTDNCTMGELQTQFLEYLELNGSDLEIGTAEYLGFITNQLIYGVDAHLKSQPNYSLLHAYMAQYKVMCEEIGYQYYLRTEGLLPKDDRSTLFYEEDYFLNMTVGQVKQDVQRRENKGKSVQLIANLLSDTDRTTNDNYDATAAVAYARQHGTSYNPAYPNLTLMGGDCTNFVSQCLCAGGLSMNGAPTIDGRVSSTTKWFCSWAIDYWGYTTSWVSSPDFFEYWLPRSHFWSVFTISSLISHAEAGSVVQLRSAETGQPYHAIFITSVNGDTATYAGHTRNTSNSSVNEIDDSANEFFLYLF